MEEEQYPTVGCDVVKEQRWRAACLRCGKIWNIKNINAIPKQCVKCKSPYWHKERLKTGEKGAANKYGFNDWKINTWYHLPTFVMPDGGIDTGKNETRWRSLAQFARRRGYLTRFDGNKAKMYAMLLIDKDSPIHK